MRASATVRAFLTSIVIAASASAGAQTFTVTNTNDSGNGSLRQAILDSNGALGPSFIHFAIPGSGVHTISIASPLPEITFPVTVDGYTQPGASPNTNPPGQGFNSVLEIEIDGTGDLTDACLTIGAVNAPAMVVQGLVINRCSVAIRVDFSGTGAVIQGNFIGTDPTGSMSAGPEAFGMVVQAPSVVVSGNLISGYSQTGVYGLGGPGTVISGNLIGTNAAGTSVIAGPQRGVEFADPITIGGTTPDARNVISLGGSSIAAVHVAHSGTTVQGNYLGTDVTGTLPLGNAIGVAVGSVSGCNILSNVIGGEQSAWRTRPPAP